MWLPVFAVLLYSPLEILRGTQNPFLDLHMALVKVFIYHLNWSIFAVKLPLLGSQLLEKAIDAAKLFEKEVG